MCLYYYIMWTVVIFIKENSIETIPLKWLLGSEGNLAYWPAVKGVKLNSMIVNCAEPSTNWDIFEIRFPNNTKKIYDNFLKARKACSRKAEESDVISEGDYTLKRSRKPKKFDSSEEEDSDFQSRLPNPPAVPGKSFVSTSVATESVLTLNSCIDEDIYQDISPTTSKNNAKVDIIAFAPPLSNSYSRLDNNSNNYQDIIEISFPATPKGSCCDDIINGLSDSGTVQRLIHSQNSESSSSKTSKSTTSGRGVHDGTPKHSTKDNTSNQFDNRILRQLVLLNHKVDLLSSDVTKILEKMTTDDTIVIEDTEIENYFPLRTDEELNLFEMFLSDDRNYKKFIQYITKLGGSTLAEAVRRTMERVIEDDFIQQYSWLGQKQKKVFGVLKIAQGMKDGIKRNKLLQASVTEASIECCMRNWMRHAKDRMHKKARKAALNRQIP